MTKVTLKGFILVPQSELELVKSELVNHRRLTLEETGCITFSVIQSSDNPLRFDVYEEFTDKESFEQHQKRVKASYWGKVTVNVERHYEIFGVNA
ncbi:antibiotic biosynthesis monooxygenase [Vibrio parahaemolyticus]|nr:antibiotic biosynthesis monooxygenase [Vibrio parahaemolyticus]